MYGDSCKIVVDDLTFARVQTYTYLDAEVAEVRQSLRFRLGPSTYVSEERPLGSTGGLVAP
jgi:hypothetical protein